jgi:hypothetical protein
MESKTGRDGDEVVSSSWISKSSLALIRDDWVRTMDTYGLKNRGLAKAKSAYQTTWC